MRSWASSQKPAVREIQVDSLAEELGFRTACSTQRFPAKFIRTLCPPLVCFWVTTRKWPELRPECPREVRCNSGASRKQVHTLLHFVTTSRVGELPAVTRETRWAKASRSSLGVNVSTKTPSRMLARPSPTQWRAWCEFSPCVSSRA